jgi:hypothetical protein
LSFFFLNPEHHVNELHYEPTVSYHEDFRPIWNLTCVWLCLLRDSRIQFLHYLWLISFNFKLPHCLHLYRLFFFLALFKLFAHISR